MAGRKSSPAGRHLAAHLQKRFERIFGHVCGSTGRSALFRVDRWPKAAARRIFLAAKIHATAAPERLVENQHAARGKAGAGQAHETCRSGGNRGGEKGRTLGSGLRFTKQVDDSGRFSGGAAEKEESLCFLRNFE